MVRGQQTRQGKKGTLDFQKRSSLFESGRIRFQPQSTVNSSLAAGALRPARMEEGGVHRSTYITWLLHHLVAVLCNDANGEKERGGGGEKFISQSGRSQVSCFCRGSQCTSLLLPYERRSVCFTLALWRCSPGPGRGEALVKLARPEYCLRGTVDAFLFFFFPRNPESGFAVSGARLQGQTASTQVSLSHSATFVLYFTLTTFSNSNHSDGLILWPLPAALVFFPSLIPP